MGTAHVALTTRLSERRPFSVARSLARSAGYLPFALLRANVFDVPNLENHSERCAVTRRA